MSTAIPSGQRGVPDVGLQASSRTGALVYLTLPPDGNSGLICGSAPCSTGWYDIGGTSLSCPQWAGIVALADQVNGGGLGLINPGLYKIGADPVRYANDFYDVTTGNNQADPDIQGYPATPGWDPVTGLGYAERGEPRPGSRRRRQRQLTTLASGSPRAHRGGPGAPSAVALRSGLGACRSPIRAPSRRLVDESSR